MAEATNTKSNKYERHVAEVFEKAVRELENAKHEVNVSSSGFSGDLMWDADTSDYIRRLNELAEWKSEAIRAMTVWLAEVERLLDMGAAEAFRKVQIEKLEASKEVK